MRVLIPGALQSYTGTQTVAASGPTLAALLDDLDCRYPGIRFRMIDEQDRIRPHIRIFISGAPARDLGHSLHDTDEIVIVQALSGG